MGLFRSVDLERFNQCLPDLAETLRKCWIGTLLTAFPDRRFTVVTASEEEGLYGPSVTFYTTPANGPNGPAGDHTLAGKQ